MNNDTRFRTVHDSKASGVGRAKTQKLALTAPVSFRLRRPAGEQRAQTNHARTRTSTRSVMTRRASLCQTTKPKTPNNTRKQQGTRWSLQYRWHRPETRKQEISPPQIPVAPWRAVLPYEPYLICPLAMLPPSINRVCAKDRRRSLNEPRSMPLVRA